MLVWRNGWDGWGAATVAQAQEGAPGKRRKRRRRVGHSDVQQDRPSSENKPLCHCVIVLVP